MPMPMPIPRQPAPPLDVALAAVLNTMPFGRPHLDEIVGAIRWVNQHDYLARGEA